VFTETGGARWLNGIAKPFTMDLFSWTGEWGAKIITGLAVLGLLWLICYWLYKRRIFIKI